MNYRAILPATAFLIGAVSFAPAFTSAANVKPRFDYRKGIALEPTALCYAKLNYGQGSCARRCAQAYSADAVKTSEQAIIIRKYVASPIRNSFSEGGAVKVIKAELYRDLGVHLEALKKKAAALQERMGQKGYVPIPEDAKLLKEYRDDIDVLTPHVEEQVAIGLLKTQDELIALLAKYVRGESASYVPDGYKMPDYRSLLQKPDSSLWALLKQDFAALFSYRQKDQHGFVVDQSPDTSGDYVFRDAVTHEQADAKKKDACLTSCAAEREQGLLTCQQDFERLRKDKCDADFMNGLRYCNTIPQEQYKACEAEYSRLHGECYLAPSVYAPDFLYPDVTKVPAEMRSFADAQAEADKAFGTKSDREWQDLKTELDGKRANAVQKVNDWLQAWKDRRAAADAKDRTLDRTSDEVLQKELELKRRQARSLENGKDVKRIDEALRDGKRKRLVTNANKDAKPVLGDYATAKRIAQAAAKEGIVPNPKEIKDKTSSNVSVKRTVFDMVVGTALDTVNAFFPALKPFAETTRGSYAAGSGFLDEMSAGSDNPNLSSGATQEIERAQKIAARLSGGGAIQTFGGLGIEGFNGGLPGTGLITPGFITDRIYEDLGKADVKIQESWTEDAEEAGKTALSRPGSPGSVFANRWTGSGDANTLHFEPKDRNGNPVTDKDGNPVAVDFSRSANWRQFGQDNASAVYLTTVDDNGTPNTPFLLRVRPDEHKVELIRKEELLESDGRKSTEVWSQGEWSY